MTILTPTGKIKNCLVFKIKGNNSIPKIKLLFKRAIKLFEKWKKGNRKKKCLKFLDILTKLGSCVIFFLPSISIPFHLHCSLRGVPVKQVLSVSRYGLRHNLHHTD